MSSEPRPGVRVVLAVVAVLCGAIALLAARRESVPLRWLERWEREHVDPHALDALDTRIVQAYTSADRRLDVIMFCAALGLGCALLSVRPRLARETGGTLPGVLLAGTVALGAWQLGASFVGQVAAREDGGWTLGDDNLSVVAKGHAKTLRAWREQIGEDDAVILLGRDQQLWSIAVWALHPRAIYPVVIEVLPETPTELLIEAVRPLPQGRGRPARWVADLELLRRREPAGHPPLVKVDG